jgi:acyl-CoA synthetase (NDP forming)
LRIGDETVPTYAFPENAAGALAKIVSYATWRSQPPGVLPAFEDLRVDDARAVCRRALDRQGDGWLSTADTRAVLAACGFPLTAGAIARTADEAATHAARLGFPVAAKLASRRVIHKSDIGAVRLNLKTQEEVRIAFQEIRACAPEPAPSDDPENGDGVLIQPMATDAIETIVGATADPLFGPLVGFGLGGTQVELFGDMRFRVAPLTDRDADELLHEGRGARALQGYRGRPAADLDALKEVVLRTSCLAEAVPEISELDLNPVMAFATGKGCGIVDARIRVAMPPRHT